MIASPWAGVQLLDEAFEAARAFFSQNVEIVDAMAIGQRPHTSQRLALSLCHLAGPPRCR